jgi:8-oxo-dGTP pyrophosphatase MutT (NUDIX family)
MGGAEVEREVRHRLCARVLPVNATGEVLLLHGWDPAAPGSPYWFSVGGGVDAGESLADAAVRETREELGLAIEPGALVEIGREDVAFDWGEWHLVQDQTYFAVRTDIAADDVHFRGLEPLEVGSIDEARWWDVDALEADGGAVSETLLDMARAAVRAVLP